MKILKKISLLLLVMCLVLGSMTACGDNNSGDAGSPQNSENSEKAENIDYAGQVKLDMASGTAKQEVTVKLFVDGDTTHFYVPTTVMPNGVLKARYLAVNTPESTGKIEEYGKKASNFTREKLENAAKKGDLGVFGNIAAPKVQHYANSPQELERFLSDPKNQAIIKKLIGGG